MDERIKEHLQYLNKFYLLLMEARKVPYDEFIANPIYHGSTERFFHLAIESCLNIGNRLIALYQFSKPVDTPNTYADTFKEMHRLGVVESDFLKRLVKMAGFRNRLVHLYWELDRDTIYDFLQSDLGDFKLFQHKVSDFLKKNELPDEI